MVGIDAGGSRTRARALAGGRVIYEGQGGPGNPLAAGADVLAASYHAALAGCPEPVRVAACVAGAGGLRGRMQVSELLSDRFPGAIIQVVPDYVAAMRAAPEGTDAVVIAGTGSVVCSAAPDGSHNVSGGRGWILGDRGSAVRLGQSALEWFCEDAGSDAEAATLVRDCLGMTDWRQIVDALSASTQPAALLARAAPVLTRAAESGSDWAVTRLDAEMAALAAVTVRHVGRHLQPAPGAYRARGRGVGEPGGACGLRDRAGGDPAGTGSAPDRTARPADRGGPAGIANPCLMREIGPTLKRTRCADLRHRRCRRRDRLILCSLEQQQDGPREEADRSGQVDPVTHQASDLGRQAAQPWQTSNQARPLAIRKQAEPTASGRQT